MGSSVKPDVPLVETIAAASIYAPKPAETYLVEEEVTVPDVVDLKTESESSLFFGGGAKMDVLQSSVQPEVPLAETITAAPIAVIKPAETYLVEEEVTVPDVVDLKTELESSLFFGGGAKVDVLQSSVQPEVPLVETITAAPIAALKPAETYLVEEEATVPDVVDLKTESESSLFFGGSGNVDVLQSSVQPETEGPVAETEEPVVETDTLVVKPAE